MELIFPYMGLIWPYLDDFLRRLRCNTCRALLGENVWTNYIYWADDLGANLDLAHTFINGYLLFC